MTLTGALARDGTGRYFVGPWDESTGAGKAQRGANVSGDYADARVVLYDNLGQPLLVAQTLADGMANPTTSRIGAHPLLYNGTTHDRARSATYNADPGNVSGVQATAGMIAGGSGWTRQGAASIILDTNNGANSPAVMPMLFNGSTWERQRSKTTQTLLASAARTSTTLAGPIATYNARIAVAVLYVSTHGGGAGIRMLFRMTDPTGVSTVNISAAPAYVSTTGFYVYMLGAEFSSNLNQYLTAIVCNWPVPPALWCNVLHDDATSHTYSLGLFLIS